MKLKDSYWNLYTYLIYKKYYYDEYVKRSSFYNKCSAIIIAAASSVSIASWLIWGKYKVGWAAIVAVAQVVSLVKPFFHFTEHICLIRLLLPELSKLVTAMETQWDSFTQETSDNVIINAIEKAAKHFDELESCYISSLDFPTRKACQTLAEQDRDDFLSARHGALQREERTVQYE